MLSIRFLIFMCLMTLAACAHHRDVRPGEDVHRVTIETDDTAEAKRDAISQANHFCESRKKGSYAAFLSEDSKYTGDMDESTYQNTKRVATAAQVAGSGLWVFGGKGTREAGGVAGLGGSAAKAAIGNGYTVDMKFKCK